MLSRERPRTSARGLLPLSAPLPSLRDALARRAAIFGPVDLDEAPAAPRGLRQAIGALARRAVDLLDPPRPMRVAAFASRRAIFGPHDLREDRISAASYLAEDLSTEARRALREGESV